MGSAVSLLAKVEIPFRPIENRDIVLLFFKLTSLLHNEKYLFMAIKTIKNTK